MFDLDTDFHARYLVLPGLRWMLPYYLNTRDTLSNKAVVLIVLPFRYSGTLKHAASPREDLHENMQSACISVAYSSPSSPRVVSYTLDELQTPKIGCLSMRLDSDAALHRISALKIKRL